jgi:quercetin dioxygenase-like cupin family protein
MKVFRKIRPEFVDERGAITRLLDDERTSIKSILLITAKAGTVRANHYHKTDSHYCYMLSGRMQYFEEPVGIENVSRESVIVESGDMVYTPPMAAHAMRFIEDSVFLAFSTRSREQELYEEDTVRVTLI